MKLFLYTLSALALCLSAAAQQPTLRSLKQALSNSQALVEMTAPKSLNISGYQEAYSYALTLKDVFESSGGRTQFGLVLASRTGGVADTISFTFAGPTSALQPAITNTHYLTMMAGLCLGVPNDALSTLAKEEEFLGLLVKALRQAQPITLNRLYHNVRYSLGNMEFKEGQARYTIILHNPNQAGQGTWKDACMVSDL